MVCGCAVTELPQFFAPQVRISFARQEKSDIIFVSGKGETVPRKEKWYG